MFKPKFISTFCVVYKITQQNIIKISKRRNITENKMEVFWVYNDYAFKNSNILLYILSMQSSIVCFK